MAYLKKMNSDNESSTKSIIPYSAMYPDGLCHMAAKIFYDD